MRVNVLSKVAGTVASAVALVFTFPALGAPSSAPPARTLVLPASLVQGGDAIEALDITVNCGYVSALKQIPELWDIKMGFDIPAIQLFHANARLGAAATVGLGQWARSIRIVASDTKCFSVHVVATGREREYHWAGSQLHWEQ